MKRKLSHMSEAGIVIAGAGPCGIGAAWTLHHEYPNQPFLLVDENQRAGGFAASETTAEGFTFDFGGHVLFPHKQYAQVGEIIQGLIKDWSYSCPVRGVYMFGRMIPAPIQRNIHRLPASEAIPILASLLVDRLIRARSQGDVLRRDASEESLRDHLNATFGQELTRRVMLSLNRKMWSLDPSLLSSVWVRHRSGSQLSNVPSIELRRLLKHALLGTDDPQWTSATRVSYPTKGGTGSIWSNAVDQLRAEHLRLGKRITAIKTLQRRIVLSDGAEVPYSQLISTIPLDSLLALCIDKPGLRALAGGLRRSSALLFGFGIKGRIPERYEGVHSFHCPEPELPFWRVTIPSNLSLGNVPDAGSYYSVLCEVSCVPNGNPKIDGARRRAVLKGLMKIGLLIDANRLTSIFEKTLPHGYPLPFLGRDRLLTDIQRRLESVGILSRGRFGGWRYEVSNQDYAFMQGAEAVRYLLTGDPEVTYVRAVPSSEADLNNEGSDVVPLPDREELVSMS
jgi:protoporphyrinogen oxidase